MKSLFLLTPLLFVACSSSASAPVPSQAEPVPAPAPAPNEHEHDIVRRACEEDRYSQEYVIAPGLVCTLRPGSTNVRDCEIGVTCAMLLRRRLWPRRPVSSCRPLRGGSLRRLPLLDPRGRVRFGRGLHLRLHGPDLRLRCGRGTVGMQARGLHRPAVTLRSGPLRDPGLRAGGGRDHQQQPPHLPVECTGHLHVHLRGELLEQRTRGAVNIAVPPAAPCFARPRAR
jgi:hypothetical protein